MIYRTARHVSKTLVGYPRIVCRVRRHCRRRRELCRQHEQPDRAEHRLGAQRACRVSPEPRRELGHRHRRGGGNARRLRDPRSRWRDRTLGRTRESCTVNRDSWAVCASSTVSLPRPGRLLVCGDGNAVDALEAPGASPGISVICNFYSGDGYQVPSREIFAAQSTSTGNDGAPFSRTWVTDPLPAGKYTISLRCKSDHTDNYVDDPTISQVALGNG
jgi:hypothetical protein